MYANDKGAKIPLKFKIHLEFENIRLSVCIWSMCVAKSTLHTYVKEIPKNGMELLGT